MSVWKECGEYLGRKIYVAGFDSLASFLPCGNLSASVLLVCFEKDEVDDEFRLFLSKVVSLHPLALVVAGSHAHIYFDVMLDFLDGDVGPQIMTGLNDSLEVDDWQSELLQATWPAEDRFDTWETYAVAAIGKPEFRDDVIKAFKEVAD